MKKITKLLKKYKGTLGMGIVGSLYYYLKPSPSVMLITIVGVISYFILETYAFPDERFKNFLKEKGIPNIHK